MMSAKMGDDNDEEMVRLAFRTLDKDGSGELTKRVGSEKIACYYCLVPSKINIKCKMQSLGNKESS